MILLAQWIIAMTAASRNGTTSDEPAHLVGGLAMLREGDYRLNPENGILPQMLAALPAWAGGMQLPPQDSPYWQKADVWMLAHDASFKIPDQSTRGYLMAGRALVALLGVGVSLMVFLGARGLWGTGGGLLSLVLCAACPNLLAHSALVTSDAASTLFLPLAAVLYWRMLERPGKTRIALAAAGLAAACLSKLSAVFLAPCFAIMLALVAWRQRSCVPWRRIAWANVCVAGFAWLAIWAAFGFKDDPGGPANGTFYMGPRASFGPGGSGLHALLGALHQRHVFPEAFLYGVGHVASGASQRLNYFLGRINETGSGWFFPYLFLVKTPPGTLAAMTIGAIATVVVALRDRAKLRLLTPWLIWGAVYGVAIITSNLNIGHRHMLPIYPTLFVLAGGCWAAARLRRILCGVLAGGTVAATALAFPHYIAYFNPLDGGPDRAWRRVSDSSLDWGQALPTLAEWLQQNRGTNECLHLSYFGCDAASTYGIEAVELPKLHHFYIARPWYELHGGLYAVSATMLTCHMGAWTRAEEAAYPTWRARVADMLAGRVEANTALIMQELGNIELARARRLNAYLRTLEPIAIPGHAILVYRLDEAEARAVENGDQLPLDFTP
ncbi:MAG: glycosyltransferase family 39 protein [Verrucomicrobiota bacterium]